MCELAQLHPAAQVAMICMAGLFLIAAIRTFF